MRYLPLLYFLFSIEASSSQPLIEWQKCFVGSSTESPIGIITNRDGGYTLAGLSYGQVSGYHPGTCWSGLPCPDFLVVNTDSIGNQRWAKCFGSTGYDLAYSIASAWDGGSIVCGYTESDDGDVSGYYGSGDAWVVKLDSMGNLQWQRCYGGSKAEFAYKIIPTFDYGYIMAASAQSVDGDVPGNRDPRNYDSTITSVGEDVWIVKLDSLGNIQWSKIYGSQSQEWPYDIIQTSDGGYAFLGWTLGGSEDVSGNHGIRDYWLGRIDSVGNLLWAKCYGGSGWDEGNALKQTPDSGFILVGFTLSHDGDVSANLDSSRWQIWVVKTDKLGNLEWEKSIGGSGTDNGLYVLVLPDSGYLIGGDVSSTDGDVTNNHGSSDVFLAKLSQSGQLEWAKCFGGAGTEAGIGLIEADANKLMLLGSAEFDHGDVSGTHGYGDLWLLKLYEPSPIEAVIGMEPITGSCTLSDTQQVSVSIMNIGELEFYDFQVSYAINGGIPVTEIVSDTLQPGDTLLYSFNTRADFSIPGSYILSVNVTVSGDAHAFNDNAETEVISVDHLSIPVNMGFENHEILAGYTVIDLDVDGRSGSISTLFPNSGSNSFTFWPAITFTPDNMLWTSCIDLSAGTNYFLSYWMKEYDSLYPYELEVWLNTLPGLTGATLVSSPPVPTDTFHHHITEPFTVPQTGTYYIGFRAFASAGTAALFLDDIVIDINTSISENETRLDLIIFPNPATDHLTVHGLKLNDEIKVFGIAANLMMQVTASHTQEKISLNGITPGMYLIEVGGARRAKFVKN